MAGRLRQRRSLTCYLTVDASALAAKKQSKRSLRHRRNSDGPGCYIWNEDYTAFLFRPSDSHPNVSYHSVGAAFLRGLTTRPDESTMGGLHASELTEGRFRQSGLVVACPSSGPLQVVKNRCVRNVRNGIGKRLRLVFLRAPDPSVTLIRNGSDCLSVLDRDPHVVEVCGAFSDVHTHNPHTPNTHTIHVAADSAGGRPSGACPGPSANQSASCLSSVHSEGNPTTSAFSADRLSSTSWIHTVHCCLPSPSATMVSPLPRSIFLERTRTSNAHAEGNGSTDPSNSFLASQQQSSFLLLSSVSWCEKFYVAKLLMLLVSMGVWPVVGTPPPSQLSSLCVGEWPPVPRCSLNKRHQG